MSDGRDFPHEQHEDCRFVDFPSQRWKPEAASTFALKRKIDVGFGILPPKRRFEALCELQALRVVAEEPAPCPKLSTTLSKTYSQA
jgi:hypothetical protein